jgi:hypothetical protein
MIVKFEIFTNLLNLGILCHNLGFLHDKHGVHNLDLTLMVFSQASTIQSFLKNQN